MNTLGTRNSAEVISQPDFVQSVVLSSGTGQAFDVPTGAGYVVFSMNADFWVRYGSTAASVPTTSSTSGSTNAEFNPNIRNIHSTLACTGISIVSESAAKGSISWYHV